MLVLLTSRNFPPDAVERMRGAAVEVGAEFLERPSATPTDAQAAMATDPDVLIADWPPASTGPSLRWLQLLSAGVDRYADSPVFSQPALRITNASGVSSSAIANHAIGLILHRMLRLGEAMEDVRRGDWYELDEPVRQPHGQTLGIVGFGSIGSRIAAIGEQLGFTIRATRRPGATGSVERFRPTWIAELEDARRPRVTFASLDEVLGESDVLVLTVPSTPDTHHLLSAEALAKVKAGVLVINVARGAVVDEAALLAAIDAGVVSAAGLDVTDPEPPPADSPLRRHPAVELTPHMAGWFAGYYDVAAELIVENLARFVDGRPLLNLVDPEQVRPREAAR